MMVDCFHPSLCLPLNCARCFPILKRSFYKVSLYNAVYFNCKTYNLHQSFPSPISSPSVSHFVSVWTHNRPEDSPLLCSLELRSLLSYKEISLKCKSNCTPLLKTFSFFSTALEIQRRFCMAPRLYLIWFESPVALFVILTGRTHLHRRVLPAQSI